MAGKKKPDENPDDENEITLDHLGGQIKFNRNMFKDDTEWRTFKAKAGDIARAATETPAQTGLRHYGEIAGTVKKPEELKLKRTDQRDVIQPREEITEVLPAPQDRSTVGTDEVSGATRAGNFLKRGLEAAAKVALPERRGGDVGDQVDMKGEPVRFDQRPDAGTAPAPVDLPMNSDQRPDAGSPDWVPGGVPDPGAPGTPQPGIPSWIDQRGPGQVIKDFGQTAGAMVGKPAGQAPFDPTAAPPPGGTPPAPESPPPGAGAPGSAPVPGIGGLPVPADVAAKYKKIADEHRAATTEAGNIMAERAVSEGKVYDAQQTEQARIRAQQQRTQEYVETEQKKLIEGTKNARDILMNPAKTPDPDRYWQSHSKVMFAIGVALTAAGKGDVGALMGDVHSKIDRDMKLQQQEFDAPRKAAEETIDANGKIFGMLRNYGLDSYEALKVGQALLTEQTNIALKRTAAYSDSALARQNAAQANALNDQKIQKDLNDAQQHNQSYAVEKANADTQRYNAQTERMKLDLTKKGALKHDEITQRQVDDVRTRAMSLRRRVDQLSESFKKHGTFPMGGDTQESREFDLNAVATDMVKLLDPEGRATVEKIEMDRKALGVDASSLHMKESTARKLLEHLKDEIDNREGEAYRARGLEPPPEYLDPKTRRGSIVPTSPAR